MEHETGGAHGRDGIVNEVPNDLGNEHQEGPDEAPATFLATAHTRRDNDPGTRRVVLHERAGRQTGRDRHQVEEDTRRERRRLPLRHQALHEDRNDREQRRKHHVHVQARIHDPVAQRPRGQRRAAHPEAQPREQVDAAQACGSRLRGTSTPRFLFEGFVDEVASLVDGPLRVGANLTRVAAHHGAQDGQPGAPTDDSSHDRDEDADRRGHPRPLEQRGNNAERRSEGRPHRNVHTRLEGLNGKVLGQQRHPVAHGRQHQHEHDGTQSGDSILLARAIKTHSEPGPDRARPQHGERKRHDTGNKPAERLKPLGAPQGKPDGQEEDHRGQESAGTDQRRCRQPRPEALAGPHVGRQTHGIERVVHRGEDDREDQP